MNKNTHWMSLILIMAIVSITGIIFLSMMKLLEYDSNLNYEYEKAFQERILEQNNIRCLEKTHTGCIYK